MADRSDTLAVTEDTECTEAPCGLNIASHGVNVSTVAANTTMCNLVDSYGMCSKTI